MSLHLLFVLGMAILLIISGALLVRQWRLTIRLRGRGARLAEEARVRDEEVSHLLGVRLPALQETQDVVQIPEPLYPHSLATAHGRSLESVVALFGQQTTEAHAQAGTAARAAVMALMRALQGLASEQQRAISEMQDRYDNPDLLQDLMQIDHLNAQFTRRAQACSVLCGAWAGQQRPATTVEDVVRGATSRIRDYLRIRLHSSNDTAAVIGRVVEPLVLAAAELLDNAARHSQPSTSVEVRIQRMHNGVVIVIDDGGVGMHEEELRRAALLLAGTTPVDILRMGDPPRFGFSVVGVLASRYGFRVSVDAPSPYGGVRAVVLVPNALLAPAAPADGVPAEPPSPQLASAALPAGVLPRRRRQTPEAPPPHAGSAHEAAMWTPAHESPAAAAAAAAIGAFQRGTRSGRADGSVHSDEGNHQA
ncbi:ATP-binding protein [Sphaerimonospora sp. CA-214678]|uniref:ATP-binding protein n=1 Tax=Sphaerimonospora sp. CA-214678 TaxID=3240029 RepID=UPI003D8AFBE1